MRLTFSSLVYKNDEKKNTNQPHTYTLDVMLCHGFSNYMENSSFFHVNKCILLSQKFPCLKQADLMKNDRIFKWKIGNIDNMDNSIRLANL